MARPDITVEVALKDTGLKKGFEAIAEVVDKFTKNANTLIKTQKKLENQQKKLKKAQQDLAKIQKQNNAEQKKNIAVQKQVIQEEKKLQASNKKLLNISKALNKQRTKEHNQINSTKGKDARRNTILLTKKEENARKQLLLQLKKDILSRSKQTNSLRINTKSLKQNANAMNFLGKSMLDITNKGRLVNNSFATMRSKLLLVSFGFGLVSSGIVRNIQAFAKQEESLLRLGLQFGSLASKELAEYASSLQSVTRFGDENINSVMSQFGAYGANIEQTKQLTEATLDLAEGQGMDLNSAALLIAKTFGSSTNALSRYGITIDSSSSKQQKINQIITQSQKKYGGLAKLLGKMSGSEVKQLSMAFGDLQERLGKVLSEGLSPIIKGLTRLTESLNTTHIRLMTEAVISLAGSFILLKTIAIGSSLITAFGLASKTLKKFTAIQLASKGVTVGLTTSLVIFKRALMASTGGLGALLAIATTVGVALFEMTGLFKSTAEEEKSANKELNKYSKTIQNFKTDNGMEQLDKFYKKLVEGNQLLRIANSSFTEDLSGELQNVYANIDKGKLMSDANVLIEAAGAINQQILEQKEKHEKRVEEIDDKVAQIRQKVRLLRLTGDAKKAEIERINALKKERDELTAHASNLSKLRGPIMAEIAAINATFVELAEGNQFKDKFIELTGVTSDFFNEFIQGSGVMESIQAGTIETNQQLVDVMNMIIQKDGKFLELSEAKKLALINEIVLKNKLNKTNIEVSKQEIKWAEMTKQAKIRLVGETLNATASLITSRGKNAKEGARLQQFAAIATTYEQATLAVNTPVKMAAIIIAGLANVSKIQEAISNMGGGGSGTAIPSKFADGGYVGGNRHSQGGTMIEAERGEFVMSRNAVESIGLETLNQMNQSGGGGSINVSVTGNVLTQDFVEGELAESIKEAVRRGSDFGIG